jgi:hypothetical protein
LIDERVKIERRVIRRTPTHWMARPTFEFINGDLVGMNESCLGKQAGELLGQSGLGLTGF